MATTDLCERCTIEMKKRIKEISSSFPNVVTIPTFSVMIVSLHVKTGSQSCLHFKINYLCYDMCQTCILLCSCHILFATC